MPPDADAEPTKPTVALSPAVARSTPVSTGLVSRLGSRHRVLELQRRRFWRELAFSTGVLAVDALTIAILFVLLAQYPFHPSPRHLEFVTTLIPPTPPALLRRVSLLLFCLTATRSYSTTDASEQSGRIAVAIVLGIVLPRWTELWTTFDLNRTLLIGGVVALLWIGLVTQRRMMALAAQSYDPRRLDQERTLLVGLGQQLRTFLDEHIDTTAAPPAVYEIDPSWPGDQHEGWHTLYEEVHASKADAIILVGPLTDVALQNALIAGSSAGCRVFGLRRRPLHLTNLDNITIL